MPVSQSAGSGRLRVPAPLLKRRLPSGRGATEQPNATGDGNAQLSARFWVAVLVTGTVTGLAGALLMSLLFGVQHLAFGYRSGTFEDAVRKASDLRRIVVLVVAAALGSAGWYWLRRLTKAERADVDDSLWAGDARVSLRRGLGTSLISEVVVGLGASVGREQAPKIMGAVSASVISDRAHLSGPQRRLLVACAAGAGLACVYNVPFGGTLFTVEILLGATVLPVVLPALACALVATVTAWAVLPSHATYVGLPAYNLSAALMVWACIAGPLIGIFAVGYIRLIGWVSYHRADGWRIFPSMLAAFAVLGLLAFKYPQLLGNGKDMAHDAFAGQLTITVLLGLAVLKPLATALCLRGGASGGVFTPALSTGAVLGGFLGLAWSHAWAGSPAGAYAMVGAAAMIGASMQAPLTGIALIVELTHDGWSLLPPILAATLLATAVARYADGYSIYSSRLPAAPPPASAPERPAG